MKYFTDFSDDRTRGMCVYCGGPSETQEHVPPRVFLDKPYPPSLPTVEACSACNRGFSLNEEYMACLVDCAIAGTADPESLQRETTRKSMRHATGLAERIACARRQTVDGVIFNVEYPRVVNVVKKVALGHVLYELGILALMDDAEVCVSPFPTLDADRISSFESIDSNIFSVWPEVGSRAMQRFCIADENYENGWIYVQRGRYRYSVTQADAIEVRMVFSEYLACTVRWEQ